jgi:hypothetical protein
MLAPRPLATGLARRRARPGTISLLAAEQLDSWLRAGTPPGPTALERAGDGYDVAYGAEVWACAPSSRTVGPLPALRRHPEPASVSKST